MSFRAKIKVGEVVFALRFRWSYPHVVEPCQSVVHNTGLFGKSLVQTHVDKNGNHTSKRIE